MQKFRDKNFIQFLFTSKIQALMVIMVLFGGGFAFSMLYYVFMYDFNNSILVTAIFISSFYILAHIGDYITYNMAKKLYQVASKPDSILLNNIKTYVSNYNAFGLKSFQDKLLGNKSGNFKFTEYFFDKSDILISNNSIFLFGYGVRFFIISYALPIEIERNGFKRYMNSASLLSYNITPTKIYLEINDPSYRGPVKIDLEYRIELEKWLTQVYQSID